MRNVFILAFRRRLLFVMCQIWRRSLDRSSKWFSFYLFSDESVGFSEDVTALRVAENDPVAAAVLDHLRADLACNQGVKEDWNIWSVIARKPKYQPELKPKLECKILSLNRTVIKRNVEPKAEFLFRSIFRLEQVPNCISVDHFFILRYLRLLKKS